MTRTRPDLTRLWSTAGSAPSIAPPVVIGDLVLSFHQHAVVATDLHDGRSRWQLATPANVSAAVGGHGSIYLITDGVLIAIDPANGTRRLEISGSFHGEPVVAGGLIYGLSGRLLRAVDPVTGGIAWSVALSNRLATADAEAAGPLAVSPSGDIIYTQIDNEVIALNARSGDVRWRYSRPPLTGAGATPPHGVLTAVATGVVIVSERPVLLDAFSGAVRWEITSPGDVMPIAPAVFEDPGHLVFVSKRNLFFRIELTSGVSCSWNAPLDPADGVPMSVRAASDGELCVALPSGRVLRYLTDPGLMVADNSLGADARGDIAIGNGALVVATDTGLQAYGYSTESALFLNGASAKINVIAHDPVDARQFAAGEMTIEAWLRTSAGGEIISMYSQTGEGRHVRLNVGDEGRIRFGVFDNGGRSGHLAKSIATNLLDGEWHHLAVVRAADDVQVFVDRRFIPVALGESATVAIPPISEFVVGSYRRAPDTYAAYFRGQLLDLRVWNRALAQPMIVDRMSSRLIGDEPGLAAYLRLQSAEAPDLSNLAAPAHWTTTNSGAATLATDLALADTVFPELFDDSTPHWPYHGYWSVRGGHPPTTRAAVTKGVVAYGTSHELYAVDMLDGRRRWSVDTPHGMGHPLGKDGVFYYTDAVSAFAVDADTGSQLWWSFLPTAGLSTRMHPPAPVADASAVAIADGSGQLAVYERASGAMRWKWQPEPADGSVQGFALAQKKDGHASAIAACCEGSVVLLAMSPASPPTPTWRAALASNGDSRPTMAMAPVSVASNSVVHVDRADTEVVARTAEGENAGKEQWRTRLVTLDPAAPSTRKITGVTAIPDDDVVVVTTNDGIMYGIGFGQGLFRWVCEVPAGVRTVPAGLHPAVLTDVGLFCARSSGTVASVDPVRGTLHGLFDTAAPIRTCSVGQAGTLFFACDATDAMPPTLRSVVFGQTYALRLGLDPLGGPLEGGAEYVSIIRHEGLSGPADVGNDFRLRDLTQCSVEAWVNTNSGGDVVSVRPGRRSGFGFRLSIDSGEVHFRSSASQDENRETWTTVHARTQGVHVADGRWHHIAVTRAGTTMCVYVDGVMRDIGPIETDSNQPPAIAPGAWVYLGADATTTEVNSSSQFHGLIGEVRVWDSILSSNEIGERMHVKLRGSEPDLIAYWNFDDVWTHDSSRSGLHGITPPGHFWLTDLVFDRPSYPYIMTAADSAGSDSGERHAYLLDLMVHQPDGSLLPNHQIKAWYVRHGNEPAEISVGVSGGPMVPLQGVLSNLPSETDDHSFVGTTGADGHLLLRVETTLLGHGPTLDVRAAFMPVNERFMVSVLTKSQLFDLPIPPRLSAQSRLIQDYHYAHGDSIGADRDRSTYRTVITAYNPDGSPRAGEQLTVWARDPVTVEHRGEVVAIDPCNAGTFVTGHDGALVLVVEASDVSTPELLVHAEFMHRNDRFVVATNHDVAAGLKAVTGESLKTPRAQWPPTSPAHEALLTGSYVDHADKIAEAVRHLANAVPQAPSSGNSSGGQDTYRQPVQPPAPDPAPTLRTMDHIGRTQPVTLDAMRQSLRQAHGADANGFHVTLPREGVAFFVRYTDATSAQPQQQGSAIGQSTAGAVMPPVVMFSALGWLDDAWDWVKDEAQSLYEGARALAIEIGNKITVAIEYVGGIVRKVIGTMREAVELIGGFFMQLAIAIKKVIDFLRLLFDWGAIVATHTMLKGAINAALTSLSTTLTSHGNEVKAAVKSPLEGLRGMIAQFASLPDAVTLNAAQARGGDQRLGEGTGVQARMMRDRIEEHGHRGRYDLAIAADGSAALDFNPVLAIGAKLEELLGNAFASTGSAINFDVGRLLSGLASVLDAALLGVESLLDGLVDALAGVINAVIAAFNQTIYIPFVSELYKYISGEALSFLDVFSLVLAVPTHIVHVAFTGKPITDVLGSMETEAADAFAATHLSVAAPAAPAAAPAAPGNLRVVAGGAAASPSALWLQFTAVDDPEPTEAEKQKYAAMGILYAVSRMVYGISQGLSDGLRITRNAQMQNNVLSGADNIELLFSAMKGAAGAIQVVALYNSSPRHYSSREWEGIPFNFVGRGTMTAAALVQLLSFNKSLQALAMPMAQRTASRTGFDNGLAIVSGTYAVYVIGKAIYGRVHHEDEIDLILTIQTCVSIFPEVYRYPVLGYLKGGGAARVVAAVDAACGIAAGALYIAEQYERGYL